MAVFVGMLAATLPGGGKVPRSYRCDVGVSVETPLLNDMYSEWQP